MRPKSKQRPEQDLELMHLTNKRKSLYIALEGMNFVWDLHEVLEIDEMYKTGIPVWMIAQSFDRDVDEVAVLIMDRCKNGHLKPRKTGIYGGMQ